MQLRFIVILFCLCLCFPVVFAETLTGNLGGTVTDSNVYGISTHLGVDGSYRYLRINSIENSGVTTTLVNFVPAGSILPTFDTGAPPGVSIPVIGYVTPENTTAVFIGSIGYQRIYDTLGAEGYGYQYIVFNSWNIGNLTGAKLIYLDYSPYGLYNLTQRDGAETFGGPGDMTFDTLGDYTRNFVIVTGSEYTAIKPGGLGINGTLKKTQGTSRVFIINATSNAIISSESTYSLNDFYFNVLAESIKICLVTANGEWYNSSPLFSVLTIPTPTPTPDPNTVPAGYTRTTVYAQDASIGTVITGATLSIRDVQNNSWINATSTSAGTRIDVLNGHTLDIYGSYPGVYTASQELDAYAGGSYYLPLYPPAIPAASGFVNLVVSVYESGTGLSIQSCGVTTKVPSGAVTYESTGTTGTAYFVVPNNSVIILSATKNGWNGQSKSLTTVNSDIYTTFTLSRATLPTATPTVTGTDGHVITAVPTVDARTNAEKDAALMNQLRDNGPMLVGLCILAIAFGILKMIMKF
jgi:hypothetical protein